MRLVMAFAVGLALAAHAGAAAPPVAKKKAGELERLEREAAEALGYAPADPQMPLPLDTTRRAERNRKAFIGRADLPTALGACKAVGWRLGRLLPILEDVSRTQWRGGISIIDGYEPDYPVAGRCVAVGRWTDDGHEVVLLERGAPAMIGRTLLDEEDWRITALSGSMRGFVLERYLARGFSLRLSVGVDRARGRPFLAPVIDWYA